MEVFDGGIEQRRFAGYVLVDGRKRSPVEVIEMAAEVLESERRRNAELRARHGLPPEREREE
jgi:hypothetical protein